jgi:hypothetical protein
MQTRLSGASRWSALETILGGGIFKRNYGEFSTGVDRVAISQFYVAAPETLLESPALLTG